MHQQFYFNTLGNNDHRRQPSNCLSRRKSSQVFASDQFSVANQWPRYLFCTKTIFLLLKLIIIKLNTLQISKQYYTKVNIIFQSSQLYKRYFIKGTWIWKSVLESDGCEQVRIKCDKSTYKSIANYDLCLTGEVRCFN